MSLVTRHTARCIYRLLARDWTCIVCSVLVLLFDKTVGRMRQDNTVFALVVCLVPPAAGLASCAARAAACLVRARVFLEGALLSAALRTAARLLLRCFAFLVRARVFLEGASLSAAIRTAARLLLRCFAFLVLDGVASWMAAGFSTLGDACEGTLGAGCMVASMERVRI